MSKPKVLVVEDVVEIHDSFQRRLGDQVQLFKATTANQARQAFIANPDLTAIAIDACLVGETPDTLELTREFRQTFAGPIIAISGDPKFRRLLLAAGCNHECEKVDFPRVLLKILGL